MANVGATILQSEIESYQSRLDKNEIRRPKTGAIDLCLDDNGLIDQGLGIVTPEERDNIKSSGYNTTNPPKIAVIDQKDYTISTSQTTTCVGTQESNDSALVSVTYLDFSMDLTMPDNLLDYNYVEGSPISVNNSAYLTKALQNLGRDFNNALDTAIITRLNNDRNQIIAPNLIQPFVDSTRQSFEAPAASKETQFNAMFGTFDKMNFMPGRMLVNPETATVIRNSIAQGNGNAVNTAYQFEDRTNRPAITESNGIVDLMYYNSNNLVNDTLNSVTETYFVIPEGNLALLSSTNGYERNLDGQVRGTTEYGTTTLPWIDEQIEFNYRFDTRCLDSANGYPFLSWVFNTKIAVITPYNSDPATLAGAINKYEIV